MSWSGFRSEAGTLEGWCFLFTTVSTLPSYRPISHISTVFGSQSRSPVGDVIRNTRQHSALRCTSRLLTPAFDLMPGSRKTLSPPRRGQCGRFRGFRHADGRTIHQSGASNRYDSRDGQSDRQLGERNTDGGSRIRKLHLRPPVVEGSSDGGVYTVTSIPQGIYSITVEAPGFKKFESVGNKLSRSQSPKVASVNRILLKPNGKAPFVAKRRSVPSRVLSRSCVSWDL